ncbi:hypothetical protein KDH_05560 [Dictyobacter sp. S3.2.2.5]|uniref:Uncharacterized protein n=1 Tax=Dictyobacter halimunensis TaxID=3026934 RepID=A0ABQ6FJ98_9CHLR|nr:hypothetical protein KDH_05560 [Dictyobacter sp. S3.2.2.5]
MLQKSITYKSLIRLMGIALVLLSVYCFCSVTLNHTESIANGVTIYSGPEIGESVPRALLDVVWLRGGYYGSIFLWGGTLTYLGIGLLLIGMSTMNPKVAYWTLQASIWLISINLWYQYGGVVSAGSIVPFLMTPETLWPWMIIALVASFSLLVAYIPVTRLLRRFLLLSPHAEISTESISKKSAG